MIWTRRAVVHRYIDIDRLVHCIPHFGLEAMPRSLPNELVRLGMILTCAPPPNFARRSCGAARSEFAQYGLAGARIDRIARAAEASKERLYAHFKDKEALFRSVVAADLAEFFAAVTLRPDAVPEFVGDIYDLACRRPEHLRMITWASWRGSLSTRPPLRLGIRPGPRHWRDRGRPGRRSRRRDLASDGSAGALVRRRPWRGLSRPTTPSPPIPRSTRRDAQRPWRPRAVSWLPPHEPGCAVRVSNPGPAD